MRTTLYFRQTSFDAQPVGPGTFPGSVEFFKGASPGDGSKPSVRDEPEAAIVRWLFRHDAVRPLITSEFDVPDSACHYFSVTDPVITRVDRKPGDVDWLCADPAQPHLAVAAECKRVKARACRDGHDEVNRIESIGKGVAQANALAELGIHRTFLVICVLVDGRDRTNENTLFRGVSAAECKRIYEFPMRESLGSDIGIAFIEIVQPTARSFGLRANVGVCVDSRGHPRDQPQSVTNRIRDLLRRPSQ